MRSHPDAPPIQPVCAHRHFSQERPGPSRETPRARSSRPIHRQRLAAFRYSLANPQLASLQMEGNPGRCPLRRDKTGKLASEPVQTEAKRFLTPRDKALIGCGVGFFRMRAPIPLGLGSEAETGAHSADLLGCPSIHFTLEGSLLRFAESRPGNMGRREWIRI